MFFDVFLFFWIFFWCPFIFGILFDVFWCLLMSFILGFFLMSFITHNYGIILTIVVYLWSSFTLFSFFLWFHLVKYITVDFWDLYCFYCYAGSSSSRCIIQSGVFDSVPSLIFLGIILRARQIGSLWAKKTKEKYY